MKTKTCRTCRARKSVRFFWEHSGFKDGYYKDCKVCHVKLNTERRRRNPEKYRTYSREYQRRARANPETRKRYRETVKKWEVKNRERHLASVRARRLRTKYGLTPDAYDQMVAAQNGRCLICADLPRGRWKRLHIDHCHKTNRIRGLLCVGCNRAIGYLSDDPKRARALAAYLERPA